MKEVKKGNEEFAAVPEDIKKQVEKLNEELKEKNESIPAEEARLWHARVIKG